MLAVCGNENACWHLGVTILGLIHNIRARSRREERACRWIFLAACLFGAGCATIKPPKGATPHTYYLKTTGYCDCGICCNWKRNWYFRPVIASGPNKGKPKHVGVTASGTDTHHGTIAADTRLFPFGTIIYVPGYGYGRVEDTGGDIKGYHIDLWFSSHSDAMDWGSQSKKVQVWLK